jgi:hypothetical protein
MIWWGTHVVVVRGLVLAELKFRVCNFVLCGDGGGLQLEGASSTGSVK